MPNRVYWAVTAFALDTTLTNNDIENYEFVTGVQSVGITTTFNLEQVFQLGQLSLFQDVEEVPDIEISVERVLDGTQLLYNRAMGGSGTISALQNNQVNAGFQVAADSIDNVGDIDSDSENLAWVFCSGMYLSSWSLACPTDGNFTESVTLVGNHKQWRSTTNNTTTAQVISKGGSGHGLPTAADPDSDDNVNVRRRQHFTWTNIPKPLSASSKVTSVTTSVDFGREMINVLGTKLPYYRYVTYPVEVTCEIEALFHIGISNTYTTKTDWPDTTNNDVTQHAAILGDGIQAFPNAKNLESQSIKFGIGDKTHASTSTTVDLGSANKCTSVAYGGGSTGGENATVTYSFRNFNDLNVQSTAVVDPETAEP